MRAAHVAGLVHALGQIAEALRVRLGRGDNSAGLSVFRRRHPYGVRRNRVGLPKNNSRKILLVADSMTQLPSPDPLLMPHCVDLLPVLRLDQPADGDGLQASRARGRYGGHGRGPDRALAARDCGRR